MMPESNKKMVETVRAKYYNDFATNMDQLRPDHRFRDIEIHVGGEVFKCHRIVLCSASEFFNLLFNGNFSESSTPKVVLRELDPRVFKIMLNFIYTGEADISNENLYDIFRAAEFYKLPRLIELCVVFIRENLNTVADDILAIFWYAHSARMRDVVEFLARHIYENFGHFSTVPEFVNLSFECVLEILAVADEERVIRLQDVFLEGIHIWITGQENMNADEKKSYSERLLEKVDLTQLSDQYAEKRLPECLRVLRSEKIDGCICAPDVAQSSQKLLRAYVSSLSRDRMSMEMTSLAGFSNASPSTWVYTGKVMDCHCDYVENLVVDDCLYSLTYSRGERGLGPLQTFRCSSNALMHPYTSLSLPPFVREYDMCAKDNDIYLYNKYLYSGFSADSPFSEDELSRGLFVYKRDVDRWLPLPRPKIEVSAASMMCDDRRLYLIGGLLEQETITNFVQAYDFRTREWCELTPTMFGYSDAASCVREKDIIVIGSNSQSPPEIYNPTSGKSQLLIGRNSPRHEFPKLMTWSDTLVSYDRYTYDISRYSHTDGDWLLLPDMNDALVNALDVPEYGVAGFLDLFIF